MNHQATAEDIQKFKFEVKRRCDDDLTDAARNALLSAFDKGTLFRMRADIYMGRDINWVISALWNHQNMIITDKSELAPFYEIHD
jgi:hypothetical protein